VYLDSSSVKLGFDDVFSASTHTPFIFVFVRTERALGSTHAQLLGCDENTAFVIPEAWIKKRGAQNC
jgi:hypothetical protein